MLVLDEVGALTVEDTVLVADLAEFDRMLKLILK